MIRPEHSNLSGPLCEASVLFLKFEQYLMAAGRPNVYSRSRQKALALRRSAMCLRETEHFAPSELGELFNDSNSINIWSLRDRRQNREPSDLILWRTLERAHCS